MLNLVNTIMRHSFLHRGANISLHPNISAWLFNQHALFERSSRMIKQWTASYHILMTTRRILSESRSYDTASVCEIEESALSVTMSKWLTKWKREGEETVPVFTTRGCSFSVPKEQLMETGLVKGHQCFCVFLLLHFMHRLQGSLVFALSDSKRKKIHAFFWHVGLHTV